MAKRVITEMIDDLDGNTEAHETVNFGLDGELFEIDLNADHAAELRDALGIYLAAARPAESQIRRVAASNGSSMTKAAATEENNQIRAWAKEHGMGVADRGRVPSDIRQRWVDAGSPKAS